MAQALLPAEVARELVHLRLVLLELLLHLEAFLLLLSVLDAQPLHLPLHVLPCDAVEVNVLPVTVQLVSTWCNEATRTPPRDGLRDRLRDGLHVRFDRPRGEDRLVVDL